MRPFLLPYFTVNYTIFGKIVKADTGDGETLGSIPSIIGAISRRDKQKGLIEESQPSCIKRHPVAIFRR